MNDTIAEPQLPAAGQRAATSRLHGSSDALAIATLARKSRPLLVVTENAWHAQRLLEEIPFFDPELKVHLFPDWETLPYDQFSPHHDLVSERLATLYQMMHEQFDVAIIAVTTALYRLPPIEYLAGHTFFFKQGEKLEANELRRQLTLAGYSHVTQVVAPGEYSFRGSLIDLFPMGSAVPYRLDLFDEEIDSIRSFDVDTQRSIYKVNEVRLLPAREFPMDEAAQTRFRKAFRETFEGDPSKSRIYKDISKGIPTAGHRVLPAALFRAHGGAHGLPAARRPPCAFIPASRPRCEAFWDDANSRYTVLRGDRANPVLPPQALFLTTDQFFGAIKPYPRIELDAGGERREAGGAAEAPGGARLRREALLSAASDAQAPRRLSLQLRFRRSPSNVAPTIRSIACVRSSSNSTAASCSLPKVPAGARRCSTTSTNTRCASRRSAAIAEFLAAADRLMLGVAPLHGGFILERERFALVTENELYATQARTRTQRETRRATSEYMLRDLSEVKVGDPVVHEQHGIGRYLGLQSMNLGEGETEFLTLEYAGNDKLYVPVSNLHLISRYSGAAPDQAPLHTLGSGQWEKAKRKAAEQVRDTAAELLNLYAQRALRKGHAFELQAA